MRNRDIETVEDEGRKLAKVPLGSNGKYGTATIYLEDYEKLIKLGVSGNWTLGAAKYVVVKVGKNIDYVARLLLDVKDQAVTYLDGDRCNLKRDNLSLGDRTMGTKRARAAIPYEGAPITQDELHEFLEPRLARPEDKIHLNRKAKRARRLASKYL